MPWALALPMLALLAATALGIVWPEVPPRGVIQALGAAAIAASFAAIAAWAAARARSTPRSTPAHPPAPQQARTMRCAVAAATFAAALGAAALMAWRADVRLAERLPAALEGVDLVLVGTVASLPRERIDGLRFVFAVESATLADPGRGAGPEPARSIAAPPRV
jgi:archaellum biogenesis protein FlaJ (TadC family)